MALYREVRQADGVTTLYHRILSITKIINSHNSITVLSYVDDESRKSEKEKVLAQPYRTAITYEIEYDPDMSVSKAYEFLKTLPAFEGAVDA